MLISALAFKKLTRCFAPLPKSLTSLDWKSISLRFNVTSSVILHPVEYNISMIAVSLTSVTYFLIFSRSISDIDFLCFFSYLIGSILAAGFLVKYSLLNNQVKKEHIIKNTIHII